MSLPAADTPEGWDALADDDAALAAGVDEILRAHARGLDAVPRTRYASGSLPVYAVGREHVLKLFPPHEEEHATVEARVLQAVHGRLPIPTPRLHAAGRHDGWHWLLMSQLHGERLVDAWPALAPADRDRLADSLGAALAALHAIDVAPLAGLPPDWPSFVAGQRASAVARQRAHGLHDRWLGQIEPFLERWAPPPSPPAALLHTEVMREHLLVASGDEGPQFSGLFDFEPAMLGAPEYDFASVGLFVACGDARFLRRVLRAYGYAPGALGAALQCRLMAWTLLHRYANLPWYLRRMPAGEATTLEQLAARWWSLDGADAGDGRGAVGTR